MAKVSDALSALADIEAGLASADAAAAVRVELHRLSEALAAAEQTETALRRETRQKTLLLLRVQAVLDTAAANGDLTALGADLAEDVRTAVAS